MGAQEFSKFVNQIPLIDPGQCALLSLVLRPVFQSFKRKQATIPLTQVHTPMSKIQLLGLGFMGGASCSLSFATAYESWAPASSVLA